MPELGNMGNHLPLLQVPQVDETLHWAWLVDQGQGNFATARVAAEKALVERRDTDTMFARAVVHQLQGEYAKAFSLFEAAFAATADMSRQFMIASVAHLAELQRGEVSPDGFSIDFEEAQRRWGQCALNSKWKKRWEALRKEIKAPYTLLAGNFLGSVSTWLPTSRAVISRLSDESQRTEHLSQIQKHLTDQLQLSQDLSADIITEALHSYLAELSALGGQGEQALEFYDELAEIYRGSSNLLGLAGCLLCQGDLIASPAPLGRPILFGYRLSNWIADTTVAEKAQQQFDRSIIDQARAHDIYLEARESFAAAGALRGEAMAILRMAYLDAIAHKWSLANLGYDEARQRFVDTGDRLNFMAAVIGELWTLIRLGEPERNLIARAEALARVARDNDAIACGLSWGLTFAHAKQDALVTGGDMKAAPRYARLAQAVFAVFNTPLHQAQTSGDRTDSQATLEGVETSLNENYL